MIQIYAISIGLSGLIDGMPHKLFRSREHLKENRPLAKVRIAHISSS